MSMTEALYKLLRKMGGTPASGDNSDELVSKIADVYSGGGAFVVTMIRNEDTDVESTISADKTCREIAEAIEQGKTVYAVEQSLSGDYKRHYFLTNTYIEPSYMLRFIFSNQQSGYNVDDETYFLDINSFEMTYYIGTEDVITYHQYSSTYKP